VDLLGDVVAKRETPEDVGRIQPEGIEAERLDHLDLGKISFPG